MKLGSLTVKNKFLLAPMDMYADSAFRKLCHDYNCGYSCTELIATAGFIRKNESFRRKVDLHVKGGLQFVTNSTSELKESIRIVNEKEFYAGLGNVNCIDINLGCPSLKMMNQNMGSALLNQPKLVRSLFKVMKKHSSLSVSAKIRLAINSKHKKQSKPYLKIAQIAKEEGIDFIIVHGRTAGQMYSGEVDVEAIKELSEKVDIPLVGNGNIIDEESCNNFEFCDAVMIGREALKRPFIFSLLQGKKFDDEKEKKKCVKQYLKYAKELDTGFQHIKIHTQAFLRGIEGRKEIIRALTHTKTLEDIKECLKQL